MPASAACTPAPCSASQSAIATTAYGQPARTRARFSPYKQRDRDGARREPRQVETARIEDRQRQHREDVVHHGQRRDEDAQRWRNPAPQQRQDAERERDVGGGREPPIRRRSARELIAR